MQDVEEEDAAVPARCQNHARVERMRGQLEHEPRVSPDRVKKLPGSGIPHLRVTKVSEALQIFPYRAVRLLARLLAWM